MIPNQSGRPDDSGHAWLSSLENCVVLCAACHDRVHENGRYRQGAVAPPSYYRYSHGSNTAAHSAWVGQVERNARGIWR